MANLYGVANAPNQLIFQSTIGGVNINCPAGIETNVISSGIIVASDHGVYYPFAAVTLLITMGATQATGMNFGLRVNNGADLCLQNTNIPLSSGGANLPYTFMAVGAAMPTAFWAPGSSVNVSVLVTGFAVTVNVAYSAGIIGILRAPDQ